MRNKTLVGMLFGGLLALAVPAVHAEQYHGKKGHHEFSVDDKLEWLTKKLSLTSEQQVPVRAALEEKKTKMAALKEQMKSLEDATGQKISSALTDEQKAKYEEMKKERKEKKGKKKDKKK